ncbi:hypothetical protein HDU67_000539 [Dinochytrium kinnereticum]|nr:hypothetical protein HDU67_000539 [Dinochytrium kinnereticum]
MDAFNDFDFFPTLDTLLNTDNTFFDVEQPQQQPTTNTFDFADILTMEESVPTDLARAGADFDLDFLFADASPSTTSTTTSEDDDLESFLKQLEAPLTPIVSPPTSLESSPITLSDLSTVASSHAASSGDGTVTLPYSTYLTLLNATFALINTTATTVTRTTSPPLPIAPAPIVSKVSLSPPTTPYTPLTPTSRRSSTPSTAPSVSSELLSNEDEKWLTSMVHLIEEVEVDGRSKFRCPVEGCFRECH